MLVNRCGLKKLMDYVLQRVFRSSSQDDTEIFIFTAYYFHWFNIPLIRTVSVDSELFRFYQL